MPSGIIKDVIDIFDTNLFILQFIFLLQFFEVIMHRKSYAVPNSKNNHLPTPHEQIVLQIHFKTEEKSINFIINKTTPRLFTERTAKLEFVMSL